MTCPHTSRHLEPLYALRIEGHPRKRFGEASRCNKCYRMYDYRLDRNFGDDLMARIQAKMNGTVWALALDMNMKKPGCPLNFELVKGVLQPDGYVPAQVEMGEEPL